VWVGFDQPRTIMNNGFAGDVVVPMWASFMKGATKGAKPQWFTPPAGIVSANVCRISGKLASDGCTDVEVVNRDGHLEHRSMVYTEYFVRGSQPEAACDLHQSNGFLGTLASVFTGQDKPAPPRIEETGVAAATTGTATAPPAPAPPAAEPPPQRRRGFWSRVFGIGRNDDDRDETRDETKDERDQRRDNDRDRRRDDQQEH
jgi:penicillin-binding protein 1A